MPGSIGEIEAFLRDLTLVRVPNLGQIFLPAPTHPTAHGEFYVIIANFSLIWGIFQVFILALKVASKSSVSSKAETISSFISWLGANYLVTTFLMQGTLMGWFIFWALTLTLWGVSMLTRAIILAILSRR